MAPAVSTATLSGLLRPVKGSTTWNAGAVGDVGDVGDVGAVGDLCCPTMAEIPTPAATSATTTGAAPAMIHGVRLRRSGGCWGGASLASIGRQTVFITMSAIVC